MWILYFLPPSKSKINNMALYIMIYMYSIWWWKHQYLVSHKLNLIYVRDTCMYSGFFVCLLISESIQLIRVHINITESEHICTYTITNTVKCIYIVHMTYTIRNQKKYKWRIIRSFLSFVACCKNYLTSLKTLAL